jgi:hypothetical protein
VVGAAVLALVLGVFQPGLSAADGTPLAGENDERVPLVQRDFFKLHPADPGAQSRSDLMPIEKRALDGIRTYYDSSKHGDTVHQAWKRGTAARLRQHRTRLAEREAGLEGAAELGVQ